MEKAVELYYEQIRFLAENRSVDVIVCVMPNEMFDSVTTSAKSDPAEDGGDDDRSRAVLSAATEQGEQALAIVEPLPASVGEFRQRTAWQFADVADQ